MRYIVVLSFLLLGPFVSAAAEEPQAIEMFDAEHSRWEVWLGIPHTTVEGLPEGTFQNDKVYQGEPMGLGDDPKDVFAMTEEDGKPVLRITGEIWGGISTLESFENYHLAVDFKWGEKKWEPRLKKKRDSGVLYHCYGAHGESFKTWKSSLEFQVQEKDMGDFIGLSGPKAKIRVSLMDDGKTYQYDPASETIEFTDRYTHAASEPDHPNGEWNRLELYVVGDRSVHVVNGEIVMALFDAKDGDGESLVRGQIQLQSEAAECYYRDMVLTPISGVAVPENVAALLENP